MDINIFILCYNEEILIQKTINFYRNRLPNCNITIYDNMSTDNSVLIAKNNNCNVIQFDTKLHDNEYTKIRILNNCWKKITKGWIIVADMDEWLDITYDILLNEYNNGTSILSINGIDMIGESNNINLGDINLEDINKYVENSNESKNICFLREKITNMNYTCGHHICSPSGDIKYSSVFYNLKHMNFLGLNYIIDKNIKRYNRCELMRKKGLNVHYKNNIEDVKHQYYNKLNNAKLLN